MEIHIFKTNFFHVMLKISLNQPIIQNEAKEHQFLLIYHYILQKNGNSSFKKYLYLYEKRKKMYIIPMSFPLMQQIFLISF